MIVIKFICYEYVSYSETVLTLCLFIVLTFVYVDLRSVPQIEINAIPPI